MKLVVVLLAGLVLAGGCRPAVIEQMAQTTVLIDEQAARVYEVEAAACLDASSDWSEYDVCMEPWEELRNRVVHLYDATRVLDVAPRNFRPSACVWYAAVVDVHSIVALPATIPALSSKWRRRCS